MLAELILDFVPAPWRSSENRGSELLGKVMSDRLHVPETDSPGAIKQALNGSGWFDGEVLAAGELRQGKEPSVLSMVTGTALIEVLRPRRSKSLPRHFVFTVTRDRIAAFKVLSTGDDGVDPVYELWIRSEEAGSWPRESVRIADVRHGHMSTAATLELDGLERVPVLAPSNDPSTAELLELLGG
jgi:hypothetical protein